MSALLFLQSERPDPYPHYAVQLAQGPLHRDPGSGAWVVYSHAGCKAVLAATAAHIPGAALEGLQGRAALLAGGLVRLANPPAHAALRAVAQRLFDSLRGPSVGGLLEELLASHGGEVDWVAAVCQRLPALALMHGLGFPDAAIVGLAPRLPLLSKIMLPVKPARMQDELRQVTEQCWPLLQDGARRLVGADDDAATCNLAGLLIQSLDAGRGLLANALLQALALPAPPSNEQGWLLVVRETLRFDPPIQNTRRVLAEDFQVGSKMLPAGAHVVLMLAAANRDPAVFSHPDRFDPCRGNHDAQLGYGHGAHACVAHAYSTTLAAQALHHLFATRSVRLLQERIDWAPLPNARLAQTIAIQLIPKRGT